MRRIDRLVLNELLGPWAFGVGLFTALLFAGGVLNRLTSMFVGGAPAGVVLRLVALSLPAIMVKTFAMATLLAGLLGFGRLSSDSELVALKAGGASVPRILLPVALASVGIAALAFAFNEFVVPPAEHEVVRLGESLLREGKVGGGAFGKAIVQHGKVVAILGAVKADLATGEMQHLTVTSLDAQGGPNWLLDAPHARYNQATNDWQVEGPARLVPLNADPRGVIRFRDAWPTGTGGVPKPTGTLSDIMVRKDDFDAYTVRELRDKIRQMRRDEDETPRDINNFEYGYYNKFSVSLAAIVFGTLGAVLGIRNHRTGTASGFALAVGIIFLYIALANFMNEWARGGLLPPWAASFAPLCIGAVACGVIIYRRNL